MDRRDWLKCLGIGGLSGAAVAGAGAVHGAAPLRQAEPWHGQAIDFKSYLAKYQESMDKLITDADQFLADCRAVEPGFLNTYAVSLPVAALPPNVYARASQELRKKVPAPQSLQEMAADLRSEPLDRKQPSLHDVLLELWKRHDPGLYRTRLDVPSKPEMVVHRDQRPTPVPDRIVTPRFTVDTLDLDAHALLTILHGPKLIADEVRAKVRQAMAAARTMPQVLLAQKWEGDGWQGPLQVFVKRETFMIEVLCCLVSGGVIYPVDQQNQAWLAERRKEPDHWHKLPDVLEDGACTTTPTMDTTIKTSSLLHRLMT